jgi:hypothetical protein
MSNTAIVAYLCEGLFIWKPGWSARRDSSVSKISLCSYFYSSLINIVNLYGLAGLAPAVAEILLERGEILLTRMGVSPLYKHSQAG